MEKSPEVARKRPRSMTVAAIVAIVFGLMTLQSGGAVLFGPAAAQRAAGEVVPFVLWFNFLSGIAYVAAGVGLWRMARWGFHVSAGLVLAIAVIFVAFGVHVAGGGAYEARTLYALVFRLVVWIAIAAGACYVYACSGVRRSGGLAGPA
jgi:hypothetical protein